MSPPKSPGARQRSAKHTMWHVYYEDDVPELLGVFETEAEAQACADNYPHVIDRIFAVHGDIQKTLRTYEPPVWTPST